MNSFMAALDKPVEHSEVDKNLSDPRQQVRNAVRNFLGRDSSGGAKSGDALCSWWAAHQEDYKDLVPGVRSILGWPAGNPDVERLFGKSFETLTPFRKQNPLHVVLLRQNAIQLGLFGYYAVEEVEEEDGVECDHGEDDESGLLLKVAMVMRRQAMVWRPQLVLQGQVWTGLKVLIDHVYFGASGQVVVYILLG